MIKSNLNKLIYFIFVLKRDWPYYFYKYVKNDNLKFKDYLFQAVFSKMPKKT